MGIVEPWSEFRRNHLRTVRRDTVLLISIRIHICVTCQRRCLQRARVLATHIRDHLRRLHPFVIVERVPVEGVEGSYVRCSDRASQSRTEFYRSQAFVAFALHGTTVHYIRYTFFLLWIIATTSRNKYINMIHIAKKPGKRSESRLSAINSMQTA